MQLGFGMYISDDTTAYAFCRVDRLTFLTPIVQTSMPDDPALVVSNGNFPAFNVRKGCFSSVSSMLTQISGTVPDADHAVADCGGVLYNEGDCLFRDIFTLHVD
jgi:hypothetical protein